MDLGINIADDLEELKNNLNKFKNSKERTSLEVLCLILFYFFVEKRKKGFLLVEGMLCYQMGKEFADMDIHQLDWVEDNRKVKAFFIYESSV
jgi:hypothetical protein